MATLMCPNASRSLLRLAGRGFPPKTSSTQSPFVMRWISCSAAPSGPSASPSQSSWSAPRIRKAASLPAPCYGGRRAFFAPRIIRDYEELPRDYRDQVGIAFSNKELTQEEVAAIFGPEFTAVAANHLLKILHGRRVAGTLADPAFAIHTAQFTSGQIETALEYLRKAAPVGEVRNAGLRAEDELNQLELEAEKKQSAQESKEEETDATTSTYKEDPIYGRSTFDRIRARNIAKQKARDKALEEERIAKDLAEGKQVAGPLAKLSDQKREIQNPRVAEYYKEAQSDMDAPPEMSNWARIMPSATIVFLVLGFLSAIAMVYEEPMPRYRLFREITTAQATVGAIIAANALVLIGWRIPPLWKTFNRYMIFVVATVKPITLFTAVFSHTKLSHFIVNMVPLWFVGTALHGEIGRADFLTLYMGCGAVGFLGSLITYTMRGWLTVTSLGASGATLGLCSAYFWDHRNDGFKIFGLPENGVHGIVFLALITAMQLAGLGKTAKLKVDIASHLAGIAAGILGIELINKAEGRKKQVEEKKVIVIQTGDASNVGVEGGRKSS